MSLPIADMFLGYAALIPLTYALFAWDKRAAKRRGWRVPEFTLLLLSLLGGALGGLLAMHRFRHKTRHWRFRILLPIFLLIHVVALGLFLANQL